jgi:Leucine-rich repeat (LRR) protein
MQSLIRYQASDLVVIPSEISYVHLKTKVRLTQALAVLALTVGSLGLAILFSSTLRMAWGHVLTGRVSVSALPSDHPVYAKIKSSQFFNGNSKDYLPIISSFAEEVKLRLVNGAFLEGFDSSFRYLRESYAKELTSFIKADDRQLDDKTFVQTIYKRVIKSVKRWPDHASILQQTRCEHSSPYSLKRLIALTEWCQHSALIQFSQKIADELPNLDTYLSGMEDLTVQEKARCIRQWMLDNSTELLSLTQLDLSKCDLIALPKEIGFFKNLITLNLSDNNIRTIPSELAQLSQLQDLDLSYNQIQIIPPELGKLSQLQKLYLSDNQIQIIHPELGKLSQLQKLYLSDNQIQAIPTELGQLSQLQWLDLSHNKIQSIPTELEQLSQLKELDLSHNKIQSIPSELARLSQLQKLDLSINQIQIIPTELAQLSQLEWLYLYNNQIQIIPTELGQLSQLQWLDLSHNKIQSIPTELGQLSQLKELDLSHNKIHIIPTKLEQLSQLQLLV